MTEHPAPSPCGRIGVAGERTKRPVPDGQASRARRAVLGTPGRDDNRVPALRLDAFLRETRGLSRQLLLESADAADRPYPSHKYSSRVRGMKQREVQDEDNTRWTCVQVLAGVDGDAAAAAEAKANADDGPVAVVCTPSGGTGTVRLKLSRRWDTEMSDEALVAAIRDVAR